MDTILSLPEKRQPGWATEKKPKQAQAWLQSLPLSDPPEAARLIYQALFGLNRSEVEPQDRFDLMDLYMRPVAFVTEALQAQLVPLVLPLPAKKKQLADFLCQLQMETAIGYKHVLNDILNGARARKELTAAAIERAVRCFGEVFLRSYEVYMPYPGGLWRELHSLYDHAERQGVHHEQIKAPGDEEGSSTISRRYKQVLLLALCGPYQLPNRECVQVHGFLNVWADKALIMKPNTTVTNPVGHFLIDLSSDSPPVLLPKDVRIDPLPQLRVLNAIGLASTVYSFLTRIQKGEPTKSLDLGTDCQGNVCTDMLRRMVKFWGLSVRRHFSRVKKEGRLNVCVGIDAVHFFASGQVPFRHSESHRDRISYSVKEIEAELEVIETGVPRSVAEPFRIDQWHIQDESAAGLALERSGRSGAWVRVGDLLGIEGKGGKWRIGTVRWLKSGDISTLEMGVEMLSPTADPVAVAPAAPIDAKHPFRQALLLPPVPPLRAGATLILPRGLFRDGRTMRLLQDDREKLIRTTQLLERTGSFEQVAFEEIAVFPASAFNSEVGL